MPLTPRQASAVVFVVTGLCAGAVAASSLLCAPWVAAALAAAVVAAGAGALIAPVRVMCETSLSEDGQPITMPEHRLLAVFVVLAAVATAGVTQLHAERAAVPVLATLLLVPGVWCAAIDQATHRIPTRLIWTAMAIAATGVGILAWSETAVGRIPAALMWGALCGVVLFVCAVITAGTPGLADVRLAVVLGTLCGYLGAEHIWALTVYATMTAGIAAAIQLAHRRFVRRARERGWLAFGPYLVLGAAAALAVA